MIPLLVSLTLISGPDIQPRGDYVLVFKSTPFDLIAPEGQDLYFWNIPAGLVTSTNLNTLTVMNASEGEFTVSVTMVTADWKNQKLIQKDARISFAVGETKPPPPPPPVIPPDDSKYQFTSNAQAWTANMTDGASFKKQIADNFEAVAAAIAAGAIRSVNESQQELSKRNRATVTGATAIGEWTVFFQNWQDRATALNKETGDKQLRNVPSDYAIAYRETAEGLRE